MGKLASGYPVLVGLRPLLMPFSDKFVPLIECHAGANPNLLAVTKSGPGIDKLA